MFGNKENQKQVEQSQSTTNILGQGTTVKGDMECSGAVRMETGGRLEGNLISKSKVFMGVKSTLDGNLVAQNAEISGEVKGTVKVSELLVLKASAIIQGDIVTQKITIEPGAVFNGTCKMQHGSQPMASSINGKVDHKVKEAITA